MAYLGKTPSQAVRSRYYYTATGGETSLSGADDNSNVLTFTDGNYVDVSLNGATLVAGSDYNTTTTNTIGGLAALTASDIVEVLVYDTFSVFGGNMAANLNFKDNVKANFGTGNDLQIFHDGSNSIINDAGTGSLKFQYGGTDGVVFTSGGDVGIGGSETTVFNGVGGEMRLVVLGNDSTSTITNNSNSAIAIVNTNHTAGNLAGLHFARADTDFSPNYAGASIVAQFPDAQVTGQYPKGELAFLTSTATNSAPSEKMRIDNSGFVGIGESAPQKALHITRNDSDGIIVLDANGTTTDHQICFSKDYGTGGTTGGNYWGIGVDGSENKLVFAYDPNAQASLSADAKVVIDSSGNVGIGTTSIPTGKLAVEGGIYLSGSSNFLRFGADSSTTTGVAIHRPAANTIAFVTSSAERARVTDNGITFNGDTAAANALDDYEEGDWTPGISAVSGSGGTTGGVGRYTKIGNQVIIAGHITPTNMGSLSGTFYVTGLPFTSKNQFIQSQGAVRSQGIGGTNHQSVSFEVLQASQNGRFHFHSSTGAQLVVQASDISVGDFIAFGLTYEV